MLVWLTPHIHTYIQLHLNQNGYVIDSDDRRTYFDHQHIEPRLIPTITTPFRHSLQPLINLWEAVEECSQHNSSSALFTFGAVAMNAHFQTLVELKGGAPVVVLYGEPDVGKTTIANAAMSVLGIEACSFLGMRREFFVHLASQTSLGLMYDDPNKVQEVENIIVDFYNGMTRVHSNVALKPHVVDSSLHATSLWERFRGELYIIYVCMHPREGWTNPLARIASLGSW